MISANEFSRMAPFLCVSFLTCNPFNKKNYSIVIASGVKRVLLCTCSEYFCINFFCCVIKY